MPMIDLSSLNDRQREAAIHDTGPCLVLATAGSGKTRVLTMRAARLVEDLGVPPERILLVTFTRKAADEMRKRLAGLIGDERAMDELVISALVRYQDRRLEYSPFLEEVGFARPPEFSVVEEEATSPERVLEGLW